MREPEWKLDSEKPLKQLPATTIPLARALIGSVLISETAEGVTAARIVETEAYPHGDPASHAYIGKRPRNATMFGPAHHAYVYLIYGTAFCFNVTSEADGRGAGVLVRAAEPLAGIDLMRVRRQQAPDRDLCRGPGRLCAAMGIDRRDDGVYLLERGRLWLAAGRKRGSIGASRRIGLSKAVDSPWRFYERHNLYVSGPKSLSP